MLIAGLPHQMVKELQTLVSMRCMMRAAVVRFGGLAVHGGRLLLSFAMWSDIGAKATMR
jgi:hypothetical protein